MMVTDKPHTLPMGQPSRSGSNYEGQTIKKTSKSDDTSKKSRQKHSKSKAQSTPPPPPQQKLKQNGNQKAATHKVAMSSLDKVSSGSQSQPNNQKQKQNTSRSSKGKGNSKHTERVVIPPRSVHVDFHSNKSSNLATLKDTSDEIKKAAAEVKDLLLSDLSINGKAQSNEFQSSPQANRSNLDNSLYHQQLLQDSLLPKLENNSNLSRSSSSCSTANRSKISSASSYTNDSSTILNTFENFKYAGSSFAAEPKAITLPKPSFLKSK